MRRTTASGRPFSAPGVSNSPIYQRRQRLPPSAGSSPSGNGSPTTPRTSSNSTPATPTRPQASGPLCGQTRAQLTPRQCPLRTFRNLKQRTSPVTPPRRHDPRPSTRQRSQPPVDRYRSETGCPSVLACAGPSSAGPSSPRSCQLFPIVLGHDGANAKPPFVSGPPSTPASRLALGTTDARRGCWRCTVSPFFSRS